MKIKKQKKTKRKMSQKKIIKLMNIKDKQKN